MLDAWGGLLSDVFETTRGIPGSVAHPIAAARTVVTTGVGLVRFIARLAPTQPLSIEGSIGPHGVWAHAFASLADVKTIRSAFGGTVNDVVLAAVTGGYRALLRERGNSPERAVVRSLVPVSTRRADSQGVPDNRVSALLYELPVHVADPVELLRAVHEQMTNLTSSHIPEAGEAVTSIGNLAPPMLVGPLSRMGMRLARRFGQHSLNTVTTNVPGPQVPLYCLGHEVLEHRPFRPDRPRITCRHGDRVLQRQPLLRCHWGL